MGKKHFNKLVMLSQEIYVPASDGLLSHYLKSSFGGKRHEKNICFADGAKCDYLSSRIPDCR